VPPVTPEIEEVWERPQAEVLTPVITKADLQDGADLARRISFSLLSSDELTSFSRLEYESDEAWADWNFDPEDREMAGGLAEEGFGTEQDIREALFDSGFLRRFDVTLTSLERGYPCSKFAPAHAVVSTLLVFRDASGAEQFFERTLRPHLTTAGYIRGPDYGSVLIEQNNDCELPRPVCCEYDEATNREIIESGWVYQGPFVIRVAELAIDYDRDTKNTTLQYAFDQIEALRRELPEYFP
jgi:hypothetical protein